MNLRYGLKEVANVIFFDVATNKPVLFFDTLKVSTIENTSESAEARGGQGNGKLMSWDFGRTATLTMQDALLSDASLSLLAGTELKSTGVVVVGREIVTAVTDSVGGGSKVTLKNAPLQTGKENEVTVYKMNKGVMGEEISTFTVASTDITFELADVPVGTELMVFYEYEGTAETTMITFSADKFPATYRVVGDTIVRGEDGIDRTMQFVIPKAKLQSTFTLSMEAENVSTFDFTLDVLVDTSTKEKKLYDIIRVN